MNKITLLHSNIINLLRLEELPLDQKQEIIDKSADLVQHRIVKRLLENLDKKTEKELLKLKDADQSELWAFLFSKFPNIEDMLKEEILNVKKELIDVAKESRQK
jgi:hypothetical protein